MSQQVTLNLPDPLYRAVEAAAQARGTTLAEWIIAQLGERIPGGKVASLSLLDDKQRAAQNRRRIVLIDKELAQGLTPAEQAELRALQAEMDRYLEATMPLPFGEVARIEAIARQEGLAAKD